MAQPDNGGQVIEKDSEREAHKIDEENKRVKQMKGRAGTAKGKRRHSKPAATMRFPKRQLPK